MKPNCDKAAGNSLLRRVLRSVWRACGLKTDSGRSRKVRWEKETSVYAFERELFGGGGVPDEDEVSLGLSPRLVSSYSAPLSGKDSKDEYACTGYLEQAEREQLLSEWSPSEAGLQRQLGQYAPLVEQTRRERVETASSRRDQRRMPSSEVEAHQIATRDAVVAQRFTAAASDSPRRAARAPGRRVAKGSGVTKGGGATKKGKRQAAG